MKRVIVFVLLTFVPAIAALASDVASSAPVGVSRQEMNKAVAKRVFEEIFNEGKFHVADQIYARDFVNHGLHRNFGLDEDQAAIHWEKKAFPDLKISEDLMAAEGDLVTVVWTFRGTNTAAASPLPATGMRLELRGITVWRIVDGKICEEWTSFDLSQVVRQFVAQLKWQILGLLCVLGILLFTAGWASSRLRFRRSAAKR